MKKLLRKAAVPGEVLPGALMLGAGGFTLLAVAGLGIWGTLVLLASMPIVLWLTLAADASAA